MNPTTTDPHRRRRSMIPPLQSGGIAVCPTLILITVLLAAPAIWASHPGGAQAQDVYASWDAASLHNGAPASGDLQQRRLQQKVSVNYEGAALEQVLRHLAEMTGMQVYYPRLPVFTDHVVTLTLTDATVRGVLHAALEGTDLQVKVTRSGHLIVTDQLEAAIDLGAYREALSQRVAQHPVEGTVTDATTAEPLPGVNIVAKGTTVGTTTDADGHYELDAPSRSDTLVFSFIGFERREVPIEGRSTIDIALTPITLEGEEVVVVGYGTQKKATLTGSVSSAQGQELEQVPVASVTNTFVGRLSGITGVNTSGEPGYDDTALLIRGASTLGDNSPLVVIDGVPARAGGFARLNPADIESISVLKDASAAIYGSRAANGVILITTKRGREGQPTTVTYTADVGARQPTQLPEMLDAANYAQILNEIDESVYGRAPRYTEDEIALFENGNDPVNYPNTDWYDETLKDASLQTRHSLSVVGGSENVRYYLSGEYQYQDGYYRNGATDYNQYGIRSNVDAQVNDHLSINVDMSARRENRAYPHHSSEWLFRYIVKARPIVNAYWPNSDEVPNLPLGDDVNPVVAVTDEMGYQDDARTYLSGNLGFNLDMPFVTEGLSLQGNLYADQSETFYKHYQRAFDLYDLNEDSGEYLPVGYGPDQATLNEDMGSVFGVTANARLGYERTFRNVHNVNTFVAYEQYYNSGDNLFATRYNFPSAVIDELFAGGEEDQVNDGNSFVEARQNYFGRVGYDYAEKYLFQFNWRYDGSQNFPEGDRFGFFPGVSVGWVASEEPFFQKALPVFSTFKLRGSWGRMGNDLVPAYQFLATYGFGQNAVFGYANPVRSLGVYPLRTPNPNITWEVASTTNIGLDLGLWHEMLSLTIDGFYTRRDNILTQRNAAIPAFTGITLPDENIGVTVNRGVEASLTYRDGFGDLAYEVGGNISFARNEVVDIDEAAAAQPWQMREGMPIGAGFVIYEAVGVFDDQEEVDSTPHLPGTQPGDLIFRDVNGDGVINADDRVRQDLSTTPELIYGLPLDVFFKNWQLSMLWQGASRVLRNMYVEAGTIGNFPEQLIEDRWTEDNPGGSTPRIWDRESNPSTEYLSTFWVRDGSYVRLKNLQLAYTLPGRLTTALNVERARIYVSGYNLFTHTFDKFDYIDPEGRQDAQGYAARYTPQARVYNLGVQITL